MSVVSHLISGAFAHMEAPFGMHPLDRKRAADYLKAAVEAGIDWPDAEQDVRDYAASHDWNKAETDKQVERARKLLEPWLT